MSVLRPAFIASSVAWALLLPLAPLLAARPQPGPLTAVAPYAIYMFGSVICHQLPERSIHLWSHQMPVCARCVGIYLGAALAAIAAAPLKPHPATAGQWRAALALAAAPVLLSLLYEWTTGRMPAHWVRAATGVPLGAVVAWMVVWAMTPRMPVENQVN